MVRLCVLVFIAAFGLKDVRPFSWKKEEGTFETVSELSAEEDSANANGIKTSKVFSKHYPHAVNDFIADQPGKVKSSSEMLLEAIKLIKSATQKYVLPCAKYPLTVDLSTQDHYIVHPPRFNSYICAGSCNYDAFHNNTKKASRVKNYFSLYAILRAILYKDGFKTIGTACCVPVKMANRSLIIQENGGPSINRYPIGVEECGCR